MRTSIPEKIPPIIDEIDSRGGAPLERLDILVGHRHRVSRFGLWVARKAAGRKGKTKGECGVLLDEARALLGTTATYQSSITRPDPLAAGELLERIAATLSKDASPAKAERGNTPAAILCRPLWLVGRGLTVHLDPAAVPEEGCQLARDWAQNQTSRFGESLSGASRGKLEELVQFMFNVEGVEEDPSEYDHPSPGCGKSRLRDFAFAGGRIAAV